MDERTQIRIDHCAQALRMKVGARNPFNRKRVWEDLPEKLQQQYREEVITVLKAWGVQL
jgi:hypothetical protein